MRSLGAAAASIATNGIELLQCGRDSNCGRGSVRKALPDEIMFHRCCPTNYAAFGCRIGVLMEEDIMVTLLATCTLSSYIAESPFADGHVHVELKRC
jgi:hypothetical protein